MTRQAFVMPTSFAQQRLWLLAQLNPDNAFYNISRAVRMIGPLKIEMLQQALNAVVARHESLRTSFSTLDEQPVQLIAEAVSLSMPLIDLSHLDEAEREARLKQEARAEAGRGFDLREPPLLRVRMLRLAQDEHVLLLTMHHIISDGWSMGVLVREVGALYEAYERGEESPLEELEVQYGDYAVWQRERLKGEELERELGYWREQLRGAPAVLELPTDRVRPPVQTYRGGRQSVRVTSEVVSRLREVGQSEGATLYMVLLGAFSVLLWRYSGADDVVVGTPVANRTRGEVEGLIGFFVNTLVMRVEVRAEESYRELVRRVREVSVGGYGHQEVPFEKVVEELTPERSLSHTPLFQVMFVLHNEPLPEVSFGDLKLVPLQSLNEAAKFDLTLSMIETGHGLAATLTYNADLFDQATIVRMLRHFKKLLEAIADDPGCRICELPMLDEEERRKLLFEWSGNGASYPQHRCLHQLFEEQVKRSPNAVALIIDEEQVTYGELNRKANLLAHHLREMGIGPEKLVGISVNRSIEMIVCVLATLKAGGAYLPLDPAYPPKHLDFMLEDARVSVLICEQEMTGNFLPRSIKVVSLDGDWSEISSGSTENPATDVLPENLAYIIYTSGSTGRPKGVMVNHANVARLLQATQEGFRFNEKDVWTLFHSFAFDFSVWEIWGALLYGGKLVIVSYLESRSPEAFYDLLCRERVTVLNQTPSAFNQLVAVEKSGSLNHRLALRLVIFGGEALDVKRLKSWFDNHGDELPQIINMYGITETTVHATQYRVRADDLHRSSKSIIGCPISDLQIYVLDERMEPVGVGLRGELYLAGVGLARGYLHRPDLTAERFLPHPYSVDRGARLYRTGDVVRYNERGELEYVGRADRQVKVRGYRIELGEVEAALREVEGVREAAVVVREEEEGEGSVMVAYVVAEAEHRIEIGEVRRKLKERLPEHMIPSAFLLLDHFPLTPNGKLDLPALPAPAASIFSHNADYFAARTITEELLCGIWAEVLKVERVGIDDNFFDLGGHSLLATQVISRMRRIFGQGIALRLLFEYPRVRELAQQVERERRETAGVEVKPLRAVAREAAGLPLSYAQQRLWFLAQMEPESSFYNMPMAVRMSGKLNLEALERSLAEVIRRHESLRTSFSTLDEQPVQLIAEAVSLSMPLIDLSHLDEAEREARLKQEARAEAGRGFDLREPPLLRVRMLRLAQDEHVLLLTMHHIISDGWSMGVLVREVGALYEAYERGEESPLEELEVQYGDYAVWQRERLKGEELERELGYWREQLRGAPAVLELPTDRVRPAVQTYRGKKQSFVLSEKCGRAVNELSRKEGVSLFMTLLAAFNVLLYRLTRQEIIIIGSPAANRHQLETENLIGCFVNSLALLTRVAGNSSFRNLLEQVRMMVLDANEHQDLPFDVLVRELKLQRKANYTPLFQVWFVLNHVANLTLKLPHLTLELLKFDSREAQFDLALSMFELGEKMGGTITYNADLFDEDTIAEMIYRFKNLLVEIASHPEQELLDISLDGDEQAIRDIMFRLLTRLKTNSLCRSSQSMMHDKPVRRAKAESVPQVTRLIQ